MTSVRTSAVMILTLFSLLFCRSPALASSAMPATLNIPRIAVETTIEGVTMMANGSMGVPMRPRNAAWFKLGPQPGDIGSAVIAGHLNGPYGASGVFQHLYLLKPGDTIVVQTDNGAVMTFVVREIRTYSAWADATNVFLSTDGRAHLNLITCAGVWNNRSQQYTKRLVVFTDLLDK